MAICCLLLAMMEPSAAAVASGDKCEVLYEEASVLASLIKHFRPCYSKGQAPHACMHACIVVVLLPIVL